MQMITYVCNNYYWCFHSIFLSATYTVVLSQGVGLVQGDRLVYSVLVVDIYRVSVSYYWTLFNPSIHIHAFFSSSVTFPLAARPFSDQGKCRTGTRKKLLELSAIPANMFHQAMNAATIPNAPPAFCSDATGTPSVFRQYAEPKKIKAIQTQKKSELNATVDLRVMIQMRKVKMNQAWDCQSK